MNPWQRLVHTANNALRAGDIDQAEKLLLQAMTLAQTFPPADVRRPHGLSQLAHIYLLKGKRELAIQLYRSALKIWAAIHGAASSKYVERLQFFATQFLSHDPAQADVALKEAHAMLTAMLPQNDAEVISSLIFLGYNAQSRGEKEEAEAFLLEALKRCKSDPGLNWFVKQHLGLLYAGQGRYAEAEQLLRYVLSVIEGEFGSKSPGLTSILEPLGQVLRKQGKNEEAERIFQRSTKLSLGGAEQA